MHFACAALLLGSVLAGGPGDPDTDLRTDTTLVSADADTDRADDGAAPPPEALPQVKPKAEPHLKLGVAIRGRVDVRFNDADDAGNRTTSKHVSFDTLILSANYDSDRFFGSLDYRFYGASFIYSKDYGYKGYPGEIRFLSYAYGGVKLNDADRITVGIQPMPFDDRYWGSSWYNSLGFVYGLEEAYNAGVSYTHQGETTSFSAGYFPAAGPVGTGKSRDSARYTVNIVRGDPSLPYSPQNAERDMIAGKVRQVLARNDKGALSITGSAWLSSVHNFDTGKNGSRRAYALSVKDDRAPIRYKLLVARQAINPRNPTRNDLIAVGDYDSPYNIAAKGTLLFAEASHPIETGKFPFSLNVYSSYSRFFKKASFDDTERINIGAFWNDKASKKLKIWTEALVGRNDSYVGAGQYSSGAAQRGDSRWKVSALVMVGYYF